MQRAAAYKSLRCKTVFLMQVTGRWQTTFIVIDGVKFLLQKVNFTIIGRFQCSYNVRMLTMKLVMVVISFLVEFITCQILDLSVMN